MTTSSNDSRTITPITVARGDGIGPEIMDATLRILDAAGAPLRYDVIEVGEQVYLQGHTSGIAPSAWDTIRRNKVLLKAPITTPQGGGYKSLNVTIRKSLNLFANVRPSKSYSPFIASAHPGINLVIIRENTNDIFREGLSAQRVGAAGFTDAVIERLGQQPHQLTRCTPNRAASGSRSPSGRVATSNSSGSMRSSTGPNRVAIPTCSALASLVRCLTDGSS